MFKEFYFLNTTGEQSPFPVCFALFTVSLELGVAVFVDKDFASIQTTTTALC